VFVGNAEAMNVGRQVRLAARSYLILCVLSFTVSTISSRVYWGYFLFRPRLPSAVRSFQKITAIVPVKTAEASATLPPFVVDTEATIEKSIDYCRKYRYECLDERILLFLKAKEMLPLRYSFDLSEFPPIKELLTLSGLLASSDEGYESRNFMRGTLVTGIAADGTRLLFLGMVGGQLSNDHYPYYEAVFRLDSDVVPRYLSGNRFFFDVAGAEGFEWYVMFLVLFLISSAAVGTGLLLTILVLWTREKLEKLRKPNQAL
jgi:hypothetical protein